MMTKKPTMQLTNDNMEDSKIVLEDGLLQPIPEDVEAELDKILDAEDID